MSRARKCGLALLVALLWAGPAAWTQERGLGYSADARGLERQMQWVMRAYYAGDMRGFEQRAQQFALPRPEEWIAQVFGAERAEPLAEEYRKRFRGYQKALARSLERSRSRDAGGLQVWAVEDMPTASRMSPRPDAPVPQEPVDLKRFQFSLEEAGGGSTRWMDSFVYVGGAFRFIGQGAFPFWDYPLVVGMRMGSSSASGR